MTQHNDLAVLSEADRSGRAVQPSVTASTPLDSVSGPATSSYADSGTLKSILGLDIRGHSVSSVETIINGAGLTLEQQSLIADGRSASPDLLNVSYRQMLATVWQEARLGGRDIGQDLLRLLPDLAQKPEALEELYRVASASKLLSSEVSRERRSEFLVESILSAVDTKLCNQGHSSLCTITDQFGSTSAANIIQIACGLALRGEATYLSGEKVFVGKGDDAVSRQRDAQARLIPWGETKSGHTLDGIGAGSIKLEQIAVRQPGPIWTVVLGSMMESNVADATLNDGQTWSQFGSSRRSIRGHESVVAAWDAKIPMGADDKPVWCHDAQGKVALQTGTRTVSPLEYINRTLDRHDREKMDFRSRGVEVNMRWSDPNPEVAKDSKPLCHTQSVVGKKVDANGDTWYVIKNPAGDYYMDAKPGEAPQKYPPGTTLGDVKNGTWWKVGDQQSLVEVRADVFKDSLVHLMVDHPDRQYNGRNGGTVLCTLGSVNGIEQQAYVTYIPRLVVIQYESRLAGVSERRQSNAEDGAIKPAVDIAREQLDKQLEAHQKRAAIQQVEPVGPSGRKRDEEVLALFDELAEALSNAAKNKPAQVTSNESLILGFPQTSAQQATPPPPPTVSPLELAQRKQEKQQGSALNSAA